LVLQVVLFYFRLQPTWLIFEKYPHLREKGGVLMLLKTTHHFKMSKPTVAQQTAAGLLEPAFCHIGTSRPSGRLRVFEHVLGEVNSR
jgi:hypothetical protein